MSTIIKFTTRERALLPSRPSPPMLGQQVAPLIDRLQVLALTYPLAADACLDWLDRFLKSNGVPQKGGDGR